MRIPELIDSANGEPIELFLQRGKHEFYPGILSDTMGANGSYLGPTIRLHNGSNTRIRFTNNIGEDTTIHGHGLHVNGDIDGGPQQIIKPNMTREIDIPVHQQAGVSWYHPHLMGKTAEQVHAGLAGLYLIEDENSKSLGLPSVYGVNDIPLIVQDRSFSNGKMNRYKMTPDIMMDGLREATLVVNGTINPYMAVPHAWIRLRLLNGSNARFYRFYFGENKPFYKIATEGGFLNQPVMIKSLVMAPGERNEIMINMADIKNIHLMAEFLSADPDDDNFFTNWFSRRRSVVELRANSTLKSYGKLPATLNDISYFSDTDKNQAVKRTFHLEMEDDHESRMSAQDMHHMFTINGKSMNMNRIDERVTKGEIELWRVTADMMPHPFHIHGVSFLIVKQNGKPPTKANRGWKDTVVVTEKPTELLMRFDHTATKQAPYMYHCHILEHEDSGMMGQFTVE